MHSERLFHASACPWRGDAEERGPRVAPSIDPNFLGDPYDLDRSIDCIKVGQEIMAQPAMAKYATDEFMPGPRVKSRAEYEAYVRHSARSGYHPVGTCKMGQDEMAVVDPQLRVHGIYGLRVADSSIMPRLVSGNTNAPSIMIGERASDFIRGNRLGAVASELAAAGLTPKRDHPTFGQPLEGI